MYKSFTEIHQEQQMPLGYKIDAAKEAIREGFAVSKHTCAPPWHSPAGKTARCFGI